MQYTKKIGLIIVSILMSCTATNLVGHESASHHPAKKISREMLEAEVLANVPGHKLTAVTVEIAPGVGSPSHRHAGFVFVYVLEGTVESQLNDGEIVTYKAGESWVEPPGTLHAHSKNPSKTETAKILAVFVAKDGAQLTTMESK